MGLVRGRDCVLLRECVCDPQTPKEFKVEMEETREVNIEILILVTDSGDSFANSTFSSTE